MMRITPKWREWAANLSPVRLRALVQHIDDHLQVHGALTEADSFLRKLLTQEIDRRYN
jgi:hypothetical protein